MAIYNFSTFLENEANRKKLQINSRRHHHFLLMLYGEYIRWLKDITTRAPQTPEITVTDLLAQLKVITDYYVYLCEANKNPKYLIKNGEILAVPESLLYADTAFNKLQPKPLELSGDAKEAAQKHLNSTHMAQENSMVASFCAFAAIIIMLAVTQIPSISPLPARLLLSSFLFAPPLAALILTAVPFIHAYALRRSGKSLPDFEIIRYLPEFSRKSGHMIFALGITCIGLALGFIPMPTFAKILLWIPALTLPATACFLLASKEIKHHYQNQKLESLRTLASIGKTLINEEHQTQCLNAVMFERNTNVNAKAELKSAVDSTLCAYYATRLNHSTQDKAKADAGDNINLDILGNILRDDASTFNYEYLRNLRS